MKILVLPIAIALLSASAAFAQDIESNRKLYINGFRSPSVGLEYRKGSYSVHTGYYSSILSQDDGNKNRSTAFWKTGVNYYFNGDAEREWFVSAAHVRGRTTGWRKDGAFLESGVRWKIAKQVEARFGLGILAMPGRSVRFSPTPGISFSIPLGK